MEKEIKSARKNSFLDSLKFEPIDKYRAKEIRGDLIDGCDDYRSTFEYVKKVSKSFLKRFPKEVAKIDFTNYSLKEILLEFEIIMNKHHNQEFQFTYSLKKPFAYYTYDDLHCGLIDLDNILVSHWYSEEILSTMWYLHNIFGLQFLKDDYQMQMELCQDYLLDDEIEPQERIDINNSIWNYKEGFLRGFIDMLKMDKPSRTIEECIAGIGNKNLIELLEMVKKGYVFDANNNCILIDDDEHQLTPSHFFGFVWSHYHDNDYLTKRIFEDKDDMLGNYIFTLIAKEIKLHQIDKNLKINKNLERALWLIKNT